MELCGSLENEISKSSLYLLFKSSHLNIVFEENKHKAWFQEQRSQLYVTEVKKNDEVEC